ncbi:DnaB-like helicase C-terminal domain-containing protein [Streptomyces sp. NPDC006283]|uniref:DnaB-like helicase C-terminal domain-containing protein n=1 Tax=Streptomyces sp. NPDC006283 TaxID=3156741 RepID=UPI0033AB8CEC
MADRSSAASRFLSRLARRAGGGNIEEGDGITPWPEMDDVLKLQPAHVVCLGTRSRNREAQVGYDIAVHAAANGLHAVLFAPDLTPRNPVPNLTIIQKQRPTTWYVQEILTRLTDSRTPADLVVIDRLQLMNTDLDAPVQTAEAADDIGCALKQIAMTEALGLPPILLIARLERPRRPGTLLDIDDLGIGANLEYHADTVALVDRTEPDEVNVFIAKDRSGPAPRHLTITW